MLNALTHFVAVILPGTNKKYFFATSMSDLRPGDDVIVETSEGRGMAKVASVPVKLEAYTSDIPLKPILRRPTEDDYEAEKLNRDGERAALYVAEREIKRLNLPMRAMNAHFDLEGSKCTINFSSENRVDFRELVKILSRELDCRIELHQVASRDRAKMIGGVGVCGLPLCCSTFIQDFSSVGLSLAKNQMLTINIPKLSGHCGKLICCLTYEDETYTEAKREFPRLGSLVNIDGDQYRVDGYNILSRKVKLTAPGDVKNVTLDEYRAYERRPLRQTEKRSPETDGGKKADPLRQERPKPERQSEPRHDQGRQRGGQRGRPNPQGNKGGHA